MTHRVHAHFRAEPHAAAAARDAVEALEDLDPGTLADLQLIVTELISNSIRHAGLRAADSIELVVERRDGQIRGEVSDPGPGFVPLLPPKPPLEPSGWGLWLIDSLANTWRVRRDRRTHVAFQLQA